MNWKLIPFIYIFYYISNRVASNYYASEPSFIRLKILITLHKRVYMCGLVHLSRKKSFVEMIFKTCWIVELNQMTFLLHKLKEISQMVTLYMDWNVSIYNGSMAFQFFHFKKWEYWAFVYNFSNWWPYYTVLRSFHVIKCKLINCS